MNIPLTYAIIRHYATPYNEESLLAIAISLDEEEQDPINVLQQSELSHQKVEEIENRVVEKKTLPSEKLNQTEDSSSKRVNRVSHGKKRRKRVQTDIDKKVFEDYMKAHKPYLDPNLTIHDLAKVLDSNRTYLSQFVNHVYKMNFNVYINHWRLREVKRLLALSANKGLDASELVKLAGFTSHRDYLRAQRIAEENKKGKPRNKKQDGNSGSL